MNSKMVLSLILATAVISGSQADAGLLITEIMYSQTPTTSSVEREWVEIYNTGTSAINLENYYLADENGSFGSGSDYLTGILQPNSTAILYNQTLDPFLLNPTDPGEFASTWGLAANVLTVSIGNWSTLSASSTPNLDAIRLHRVFDDSVEDEVVGYTASPFPASVAQGHSIYLSSLLLSNDSGQHWEVSGSGLIGFGSEANEIGNPGIVPSTDSVLPEPGTAVSILFLVASISCIRHRTENLR